jgi:ABC-type oligopeptide transport system substrate-binding subunit
VKRRRQDRESGATVVEFVVFTPILFLLMFGSVQVGLALFARHVASSAAQEGARQARETAENTNVDWQTTATGAATSWVTQLLGTLVEGTPNAKALEPVPLQDQYPEVGVQVQFRIVSIVPGWHFTLKASSVGPVECFYTTAGYCDGD